MPEGKTVLIKVGGSLLSLKDLCARLRRLIAATEASNVFIVPGGGEITDFVRHWDRIHSLETPVSHQLASYRTGLVIDLPYSLGARIDVMSCYIGSTAYLPRVADGTTLLM